MGVDVAIIGAGAAGIAAARRLTNASRSVLLIDALDRLGGRAWTLEAAGLPLDMGCGWLHSAERNPWAEVAEAAGAPVDRSNVPPNHNAQSAGQQKRMSDHSTSTSRSSFVPLPSSRGCGRISANVRSNNRCRWRTVESFVDASTIVAP